MRRSLEIMLGAGGALSTLGGILLFIYLDNAKDFLNGFLGQVLGVPESSVGYYVVTVIIGAFFIYGGCVIVYGFIRLLSWAKDRYSVSEKTAKQEVVKQPPQATPGVEVKIGKRTSAPSSDPTYRMVETLYGKKPKVIDVQLLYVKVLHTSIHSLGAKIWLDGDGPTYLKWPTTKKSIDVSSGHLMISESPRFLDFVAEQQEILIAWVAFRDETGEYLHLHTDTTLPLLDLKKLSASQGRINIDIQFIGEEYTDPSPRRFRLNAASWNDLNLTERE